MKKIILGLILILCLGTAQAAEISVSVSRGGEISISGSDENLGAGYVSYAVYPTGETQSLENLLAIDDTRAEAGVFSFDTLKIAGNESVYRYTVVVDISGEKLNKNIIYVKPLTSGENADSITAEIKNLTSADKVQFLLGFATSLEQDIESEEMYGYISSKNELEGFAEKMAAKISVQGYNTAGFAADVKEQLLLQTVSICTAAEQQSLLENNELITGNAAFNSSGYAGLSDMEKAAVWSNTAKKTYSSLGEFIADLNEGIDAQNVTTSGGTVGSGGGGRGSSSKGGSASLPPVTLPAVKAEVQEKTFADMEQYEWAEEAVSALAEKGIVAGYTDGSFRPGNNVTRAEFVKMAVETFGLTEKEFDTKFSDVPENAWYAKYVYIAASNGIVKGYDGRFNPDANITREDMAVIIYNIIANGQGGEGISFADSDEISGYARSAVAYLSGKGIINGSGGRFYPKNNATRAEACQILYNCTK